MIFKKSLRFQRAEALAFQLSYVLDVLIDVGAAGSNPGERGGSVCPYVPPLYRGIEGPASDGRLLMLSDGRGLVPADWS